MKTKMMKRAAAFAASVLMTAAMAMPASAADAIKTNVSGIAPAVNVGSMEVAKKIYLTNSVAGTEIYAPNIDYTYEVAPVESTSATITGLTLRTDDAADKTATVTVKKGAAGGVLLSSDVTTEPGATAILSFGDEEAPLATVQEVTNVNDPNQEKKLTISTVNSAFTAAGVYRYTLTETVDKASKGVTDVISRLNNTEEYKSTVAVETRYLDVYVKANDAGTGFEVYGLVLTDDADPSYEYDASGDKAGKISELDPDLYDTYNVKVQKNVEGQMADKTHEFPFSITLTSPVTDAEVWYTENDNGAETSHGKSTAESVLCSSVPKAYTFRHGDWVQINGIPAGSNVTISETNNTSDTYDLTVKKDTVNVGEYAETLAPNGNSKSYEAAINQETATDEIIYTNTLEAISPTGVLFRIAPYALMMTAGGVLIAVYLRGKKREDAESMI